MKSRLRWSLAWLVIALCDLAYGQDVVKFGLKVDPARAAAGNQMKAVLTTRIDEGWHLYSMTQPPGGPIPTTISVENNPVFLQAGAVQQPAFFKSFDKTFGIETEYFEGDVDFQIPVRIDPAIAAGRYTLPVKITFIVCSDNLCLPPQTKHLTAEVEVSSAAKPTSNPSRDRQGAVAGVLDTGHSRPPPSVAVAPAQKPSPPTPEARAAAAAAPQHTIPLATWAYLSFAMAMGGLALLTPCVFPMIPITVSYFTKREATKKRAVVEAGLYSVGIVLTFTVIGFILTFLFGAGGINRLAANPLINTLIALIFIVFALSLFGVMELRLPSSWINAANRKSGGGGVIGILLMALTFSLTSFTCTVPFVGSVMVAALHGDWLWSLMGVTAFAAVFSAPFFFLAMFPSWLHSLPKSGNWMNSVKISMGFLELAAALKFISNVDMVYQAEVLTRPVFITIWLSIALVTTLYLLGKFHFPHEIPTQSVGAFRVLSAIFFLAVSFYLVRGLFGLSLGELDAFLPPRDYGNPGSIAWNGSDGPEPQETKWLDSYQAALTTARLENRPIFIDFTGYTCTNCRWMESNIFVLPEVDKLFRKYLLVRLYTDGTEPQHAENLRFEQTRFGTIALPLYAIMSPQDEIVATFPGLTRSKHEFVGFLKKGLEKWSLALPKVQNYRQYRAPQLERRSDG